MAAAGPQAPMGRRRRGLLAALLLALPAAGAVDADANATLLTDSTEAAPTTTTQLTSSSLPVAEIVQREDPEAKRRHCTPKHDKHGVWNGSTEPGGEYVLTCDHGYAVDKQRTVTLTCSEDEVQWNADPWCENMDDCAERMYGCGPAGLCVDKVGYSECICERGAVMKNMNNGEQVCYFKNETKHCGGRNCGAHGICVDLTQYQQSFDTGDSSFRCSCERGFEDDGSTCNPVDCGERYDPMGTWSGSSAYLGEYTLECREGAFVLGGSQKAITVSCPADGRWESERMFNTTPPKCLSPTQALRDARVASLRFWTNVVMALCCICGAACAAGLTMGLLSLEPREMEIIQRARLNDCLDDSEREKLEKQKDAARHILPLIKDHHLLLVTLLLLNALANEALPIFLDQLVSPFAAVLMSVTFVLMCGEILPSAVFTGPLQLTIASMFIPCVKFLLCALYPIAKPIAIVLDHGLPHKSAEEELYSRPEIRAVLSLHTHGPTGEQSRTAASSRPASAPTSRRSLVGEETLIDQEAPVVDAPLDPLESQICFGILDLGEQSVMDSSAFRSLRRCASAFHAVLQSARADAAALSAAKAGADAVVVFRSLELVKWPIEVPLEELVGVLPLPSLLVAPPGACVGELCAGTSVAQVEADETITNALSALAIACGTPCTEPPRPRFPRAAHPHAAMRALRAPRRWKSMRALCMCLRARASLSKVCWVVLPLSLLIVVVSGRNLAAWRSLARQPLRWDGTEPLGQQALAQERGQAPPGAPAPRAGEPPALPFAPYSERASTPAPARPEEVPPPSGQPAVPEPVAAAAPAATAALAAAAAPAAQEVVQPEQVWIFCAEQWQECACRGNIRWGNGEKWHEIKQKNEGEELRVKCSVEKLPDVAPGDVGKHCQCAVQPGSPFHRSLNPGLLRGLAGGGAGASLATSCELLQAGAGAGDAGASLWQATEAFCSPAWGRSADAPKAGKRALGEAKMQEMMLSWVDPRFLGNYKRFFDSSGWAARGFVNYYAGPPSGRHTKMTEELVKSVHLFSAEPIIVVHFGFSTPTDWTAERFPQLVLLHAAPIPVGAMRSFNFNKFRAMLLARVRVGVELDSDQFVAPGVDAIFGRTAEEVTKDYPFPILPVHFLDRSPRDLGAYWARYCPKDKCRWQTARWGHAHPTWTHWALPFLGRWLRRNFRDETLPVLRDGAMSALRVVNVPEDEDLLNIGTWEEGGTKQWCKLDLPGPGDFEALLSGSAGSRDCRGNCGDISGDRRFHPRAAAKAFYTAHHAVDPAETRRYVERLKRKLDEGSLPPPILYHGKFYASGKEMKAAHPDATCLI